MKLTLEEARTAFSGFQELRDHHGAFLFERFTPAQRDAAWEAGHRYHLRSFSVSGVCLDVITDADALSFDQVNAWMSAKRPYVNYDLYIDGVLYDHKGVAREGVFPGNVRKELPELSYRFELPAGEKRVTLYLPELAHVELKNVELEGARFFTPWRYDGTLVAFGDSITEGTEVRYAGMVYIEQVARLMNYKLYDFGIGGDRFTPHVLNGGGFPKADLVTVALGTNDFARTDKETFLNGVKGFLKRLHELYPDTPTVLITPVWRMKEQDGEVYALGSFQEMRDLIRREAERYPTITVAPGEKMLPRTAEVLWDGTLHPNDFGNTQYALRLFGFLVDRGFYPRKENK
ncbi:MAG: SGNH/GDSL hydrolase family protein [Clostridia bacterium]|nr:SGNH/GDSL hydrolase family protein [Clostridia bacterium]